METSGTAISEKRYPFQQMALEQFGIGRKGGREGGRSLEANLTSYTKINSDHRFKSNYKSLKRIYRAKSLLPKSMEEFLSVIPKA